MSAQVPPRSRVLIVDDNRDHLTMLATLLRALNQEVQTASNGAAAIWIAASFQPQVIFLDLSMPNMHGYDVARVLRQQPSGADMKIVAITGFDSESDRDNAMDAGCDELLRKPASLADITAVLNSVTARPALKPKPADSAGNQVAGTQEG